MRILSTVLPFWCTSLFRACVWKYPQNYTLIVFGHAINNVMWIFPFSTVNINNTERCMKFLHLHHHHRCTFSQSWKKLILLLLFFQKWKILSLPWACHFFLPIFSKSWKCLWTSFHAPWRMSSVCDCFILAGWQNSNSFQRVNA